MPLVVPVKFTYSSRDLWFDPQGIDIVEADHAICRTERGTEIGLVTADPFEVPESELAAPLKPVLRVATDDDLDRAAGLAERGEAAMGDFRRLVEKNKLDMKPVGVEYLFGGEKAVFYFAAEERVDFRQLVKDLSSCFHTRVDMRQIGVRDEARLVGGYAQCGQELCCARFKGQFEPVSIRMAKEQDLPLNSSKISGVCGRLMCCLRYEFEAYKDFKGRAPKKKALIDTPLGKAKIQEYDTPREQLVLRLENGKVFRVNLSDMTCSEASKKRSAEQGCACRPDCVTRDILEKIESADISLALMELDRENGVDVGDGLDQADRLIESSPTPRRKHAREGGDAGFKGNRGSKKGSRGGSAGEAAPTSSSGRRRRKRGISTTDGTPAPAASATRSSDQAASGASEGQAPARRRRHHVAAAGEDAAASRTSSARASEGASAQGEGGSSRRSRRRRSGSSTRKPDVPSVAEQVSESEVRVTRRRPGDGGGAARRDGEVASSRSEERPSSREEGTAEGTPQKRRRRRRSRKPRSSGDAGAQGSAPRADGDA